MMQTNPATLHQAYQAFPPIDVPFVDSGGRVSRVWYDFLVNLWWRMGAGMSTFQGSAYANNEDGTSSLFQSYTGKVIGPIPIPGTSAGDSLTLQALEVNAPPDQQASQALLWGMLMPPQDVIGLNQAVLKTLEISPP